MQRILIWFLLGIACSGCDLLTTTTKPVMGNIELNNLNQEGNNGYNLVIDGSPIVQGFVTDVWGNDSTLLVRAIDRGECVEIFYEVYHKKGQRPIKLLHIEKEEYESRVGVSTYNISIRDLQYVCP